MKYTDTSFIQKEYHTPGDFIIMEGPYSPMRLLIMPPSFRRRQGARTLIDMYDGVLYRVLRAHLRPDMDILILTDKLELKSAKTRARYRPPLRMSNRDLDTRRWEREIPPDIAARNQEELRSYLRNKASEGVEYDEMFIAVGGALRKALGDVDTIAKEFGIRVRYISGPLGKQARMLKEWLLSGG